MIYNIQSYSIHDGPGIRAIIFLKGCLMKCDWCSNPESQKFSKEIYYSEPRCIKCGLCVSTCPNGALTREETSISVDRSACKKCGHCVEVCPTEAIAFSGRIVTPDEVIAEVNRDWSFIMNSGGGITFSGGEPFEQAEFVSETAKRLKKSGYHIAVETSGYTSYKNIEKCLDYIDLLLFDLKTGSDSLHKKVTGCSNKLILENLKKVYAKVPVIIRIPIIPGINDTEDQLNGMIETISRIDPSGEVNLLPYHQFGKSKYKAIGRCYKLDEIIPPSEEHMKNILRKFVEKGLRASIV
ncbi:MAG: glycyl-radical enzyme activating protein [Parabacteroides sp.]|nr:glycyl-radical enzyme activating protein [Parabacteroides sp.]